jgi:DNA polymerase elongation subunit (family B)
MKVRWAGYKGDKLLVMADGSLKPLTICRDIPCPYAFILEEKKELAEREGASIYETDLREHLEKRRVARYEVSSPKRIAEIRDRVGYSITFEADIPYVRRLFVDRVLEPDWSNPFVWIDIEVDDTRGFPKPERDQVVSIAYSLDGSRVEFMHIGDYGGEKAMLNEFKNILLSNGKSVAVGWNIDFDLSFLRRRGKIEFLSGFDLMEEYKNTVKGLEHYSLDFVARHEGLGGKLSNKRVHEMSRQELEEYNKTDVSLLLEIDKRYGFSKLRAKIGELVGLLNDDLTPVRIGDILILRRARELGFVLSNTTNSRKKGYPGAVVLEPLRKGLVRNVAVVDYESLYPNIIVIEKIDIPGFSGEVMPYIESKFLELRREAKEKYKKTGDQRYDIEQQALKILANSLYGLFGTEGFRFFDESIASRITAKGREMLLTAKEALEALGYVVIYGDTDSIFVVGWRDENELDFLVDSVNVIVNPYKMKLEYVGDLYIMAKKRYILRTRDGREVLRGVELVRSDWAPLFKRVVRDVVDIVFRGGGRREVKNYLAGIKLKLWRGELNNELIICKGVSSREYKVEAEHIRAAKKWSKLTNTPLEAITRICYYYVNSKDGVEPVDPLNPVFTKNPHYQRYWERIMALVERIVAS